MAESILMNRVNARPVLLRGMVFLVISSALIVAMLTPLEPIDLLYFTLSSWLGVAPEVLLMVSDILLLTAGFLIAASFRVLLSVGRLMSSRLMLASERLASVNRTLNWKGLPALITAGVVLVFWHIPSVLDVALLSFDLHWVMHVSIFFAGVLVYVGFTRLTLGWRLLAYLLGCKGMLILGAYLLVSPVAVYGNYPYPEQLEAGAAMVGMCLASDVTIIPLWARRYFSQH